MQLWDLTDNNRMIRAFTHRPGAGANAKTVVAFGPDGNTLVTADAAP